MVAPLVYIGAAIAGKLVYDLNTGSNTDEQTAKKRRRAIRKNADAQVLVQQEREHLEKRLNNVGRKRLAVIQYTMPRFIAVYGQIQTVLRQPNSLVPIDANILDQINVLPRATMQTYESLSSREELSNWLLAGPVGALTVGRVDLGTTAIGLSAGAGLSTLALGAGLAFFTLGIGSAIKADSERALHAASRSLSAANAAYAEAESKASVCKAICAFADRIASLTAAMNALFLQSIGVCEDLINRRGTDVSQYDERELKVLMTCANMAGAMCTILKVPISDKDGKVATNGKELIADNEKLLNDVERMCSEAGL